MLQKMLFVGVGGSGGKTLRILHQELDSQLRERGWTSGLPAGWRFIHVDVPPNPDGNDVDLPAQLPAGSYVGLSARNVSYQQIDAAVARRGELLLEQLAGWRPDPQRVHIAPRTGAGQFRAVGRMVGAASMQSIVEAINRARVALTQVDVDPELREVSKLFGDQNIDNRMSSMGIVVSSLAGGSGAGLFLDICDALRMTGEDWLDESIGILYAPDVFGEIKEDLRAGIQANALASLMELLAGYWNSNSPDMGEFALLETAGMMTIGVQRRGPRYPFVVGRGNQTVTFSHQNQVYKAVGRTLATWVTSREVQDHIRQSIIGNWQQNATAGVDHTNLAPKKARPLSAFGFASVGLARDRFARYSADRLAWRCVDVLLRAHRTSRTKEEEPDEVLVERLVEPWLVRFKTDAGLFELGSDHNDILDAIRGGPAETARNERLREELKEILNAVTEGRVEALTPEAAAASISGYVHERRARFVERERASDREHARAWVDEIQVQILAATANLMALAGAAVTSRVLEAAISELRDAVIPELDRERETASRNAQAFAQLIHSEFAGVTNAVDRNSPLLEKAARRGTDSYYKEAEASLLKFAAELIGDLAQNFLTPLKTAVDRARAGLESDETSTPERRSPVDDWKRSNESVPRELEPAENEFLLEDLAEFPDVFIRSVQRTVGATDETSALKQAVQEIVTGSALSDGGEQTAIRLVGRWAPKGDLFATQAGGQKAQLEFLTSADDIHQRAATWVSKPNTHIGDYCSKGSLRAFLAEADTVAPQEHDARLDRFARLFAQALETSAPFVQMDTPALLRVHGRPDVEFAEIPSPIPFPRTHPAREIVFDVLRKRNKTDQEIEGLFKDVETTRIDITTFLGSPVNPLVMGSLMGPIAAEMTKRRTMGSFGDFWTWRRARPLAMSIPLPPDVRLAMVRGWFTARALNQVEGHDAKGREAVRLWSPEGWRTFPYPLLGGPVQKLDETLPALLESLPIALLDSLTLDLEPLAPYWRLADLGQVDTLDVDHDVLHEEVQAWLLRGEVPKGAPAPSFAGAPATREARLQELMSFFQEYLDHYGTFDELTVDADSTLHFSRAWELRRDITLGLRQLYDMCKRAQDEQAETGIG